jgi:AbrB family looped-hinge helix DNA binding protein
MPVKSKIPKKMKIFPKGQVVIPVELRRKYHLAIGDHVNVVSTERGILLKPDTKPKYPASLTSHLFGIFHQQAHAKPGPTKKDINRITETAFGQGWKE